MADQAELIRQQMEDTRASMTEKIEALEKQVGETVKETTQTVAETVDVASETVTQTVEAISETVQAVRETLDIPGQIEKHPWVAVGGALVLGYFIGMLVPSAGPRREAQPQPVPPVPPTPPTPQPVTASATEASRQESPQERKPSLADIFGSVKDLALGTAVGVMGEVLLSAIPNDMKSGVSGIFNQVAESLGIKQQSHPA